jgi:integrase
MGEADLLALQRLFWKIWAHPDLIAFPLVAASLREIGGLAQKMWNEQLDAFGVERWSSLSVWLEQHLSSIVSEIRIDQRTKQVAAGKNPVLWRGVGLNAVYAMLCDTHVLQKYRESYRLLQGHILFAFSLALGAKSSLETYQEVCLASRDDGQEESKQNRAAKEEPLPKSCSRVGRALRRLSRNQPAWIALLGVLEVNRSPASFSAWIETFEFAPGTADSRRAQEDFRAIRSFLVTIYSDHWKSAGGTGTRTSTVRNSVHGRLEFGLWGSVFQLPTDELGGRDGDQFYFFINALTEEERQKLGDSDDDADEGHEFFYTRPSKPGSLQPPSWKQNNRKMMANQLLPYDYDELNGSELGQLWSGLISWWKKHNLENRRSLSKEHWETLEVGALLWVMLFTGSPIERAMGLTVPSDQDEQSESPLSLLITRDENGKEVKTWRIKALPPRASTEDIPNSRPVIDHILLPDVAGGSAWVMAFRRIRKRNNRSVVFRRSLEEYQGLIRKLFKEFNVSTGITDRITADRYSKVLFWRLLRGSVHDFTAVSMVTGQDHVLNRSRLHYTTRQVAMMQRLYIQCAEDLASEIASVSEKTFHRSHNSIRESETYLGARHCPTLATVTTAISALRDRVRQVPRLQVPRSQAERRAFVSNHDALTLYAYWMFAFATGVRGVVDPYPRIERVDIDTGILTIEDKAANSGDKGYKSRLVWLPHVVREQMQAYQVYLDELKRKYKIDSKEPSFFLHLEQDRVRPVAIRPTELESRVEELLPFPANTQRLFLRSELLDRGCSVEVVDAFMGHWCFGEEPWAPFSTFNYAVYFASLERYVAPLLKEIGFDVVRKRVVN